MTLEAVKISKKQDSFYKLEPSSSNETSINLTSEILQIICPNAEKGSIYPITFSLHKEDFIKAICFIITKLPLYTSRTEVNFDTQFFENELKYLNAFFTEEIVDYTVSLYYREDGRIYLRDLKFHNFNIRRFIIEGKTRLRFICGVNKELRLEFADFSSGNYPFLEQPLDTYEKLAVQDKTLKDFVYKVVYLLSETDNLKSIEPYANFTSENIQIIKKGCFHLTGMFIATTPGNLAARNRYGEKIRWFDKAFSLCGETVYLSTQWYGNGHYTLMYDDFAKLVENCYGKKYSCHRTMNNEFELYEKSE